MSAVDSLQSSGILIYIGGNGNMDCETPCPVLGTGNFRKTCTESGDIRPFMCDRGEYGYSSDPNLN